MFSILSSVFRIRGKLYDKVYYVVHNKQRVRAYAYPTNTFTLARFKARFIFKQGVKAWQLLPAAVKDWWDRQAERKQLVMSGYNLFLRVWMKSFYS